MKNNQHYRLRRTGRSASLVPVLGFFLLSAVLAFIIAGIWQTLSGDGLSQPSASSLPTPAENVPAAAQSSQPSESAAASSSLAKEPEPDLPPQTLGAVPASARVKSDYFSDAVFIGDSLTTGISLYGVMSDTDVLAGTGINLDTLYTNPVIKLEDGSRITIMDGLSKQQYSKVYIMLGGNEVRDTQQDLFISRYSKVLDDVRRLQPDATIYVQSILPVTTNNKYNMDNTRIDSFNQALLTLCESKDVYYLNVAECMKNEAGALPDDASPADGMHFGADYYQKWFEYLKTHTIQP